MDQIVPRQLQFDRFTLDLMRGCVRVAEREIELPPKAFDVLRVLAENAGRLVSKQELHEAVWPHVTVTDESLVQRIRELRQVLGDDDHSLIKTVSRRGYLLNAELVSSPVSADELTSLPQTAIVPACAPDVAPAAAAQGKPGAGTTEAAADESETAPALQSEGSSRRSNRVLAIALSAALVAVSWMLWQWQQVPGPPGVLTMMAAPTIAVVPFTTLGSENGSKAGLEAEIRSELARAHRGFDLVIKSVAHDREPSSSLTVARLGARYVVDGTMLPDRDVQRANIRLIETETDQQIWSEPFEFKPGQSDAVNRVAARIARSLIIHVRTAESRRPLPAKVEAGHYALQGRALHETERSRNSTREAQSLFKQALELDVNSVPALQGFAITRLVQVHNAWIPWEERQFAMSEADDAIERLIKLDPRNAPGHYLRASLLRARGEVDMAIASLNHALSLNPNYFAAHAELGRIKIEAGRAHESVGHIQEALELNPSEPNIHVLYYWAGMAALHIADDQAALEWLLKARQANPSFSGSASLLAVAYLGIGEEGQAQATMAEFLKIAPRFSIEGWKRWAPPTRNPIVGRQRERIWDAWRQLGAPEHAPAVAN
jgi:DNA-binding winged helix-turn-helix (wHTH) protein/tetratricopeptide (TPR) repeat protein